MDACWYCGYGKGALREIIKESPDNAFGHGTTRKERYFICRECYAERSQEQAKPEKPKVGKPLILENPQKVVDQIL